MPLLIRLAKKRGNAAHAGPGENIWSNVHIDDLVTLYALAIEKAPAGSFYFAENGENSMREACEAINRMLGFAGPPTAMSMAEAAAEWGEGTDGGHDGLQQPGAGEARAAARLEAEGARLDRRDRAGVLPGVGLAVVPANAGTHTPRQLLLKRCWSTTSRNDNCAVVMGPCVRRDDAGCWAIADR